MMTFGHWTPRYIFDRIAVMRDERAHPEWPWLTRQMIGILETWPQPADVGLEFGSGRSTVWFARRVGRLTSVEHDPDWYHKVHVRLRDMGDAVAGKVDYRLCEDGAVEIDDCS